MDPSDELIDERKQKKLAQMARRNEERKLGIQSLQDERNLTTSTGTGRKTFEQEYPQMKSQIEDLLQKMSINENDNSFQELVEQVQRLEKFITEHATILRPRDLANAQTDVLKLRNQLINLQDRTLALIHRVDFQKQENHENKAETNKTSNDSNPTKNYVVSANTVEISNKTDQLIRLNECDISGKDVAIENLVQCKVFLCGVPSSIQIKNLQSSVLIVGPCSRSILIDQCVQCEFAFGCQQLRVHTSSECDFYVHITAQPIIEDCQELRFAPYNVKYELKDEHIRQSGLNWSKDYWDDVRDFNHMIPGIPSPNWSIIEEEERKEWGLG